MFIEVNTQIFDFVRPFYELVVDLDLLEFVFVRTKYDGHGLLSVY